MYEGTPAGTFDTDRRVGCRWTSDAPDASRSVAIDFERVVSYDPSVSDDDRAREVYAKKEDAADLPSASLPPDDAEKETPSPEGSPTGREKAGGKSAGGTAGKTDAKPDAGTGPDGSATGSADDATGDTAEGGTAGSPTENLQPRVLDTLGDSAFLDDLLTRAGSTAQHRTVSVVFRTSNVIVTIEYTAQPALSTEVPDSKELQEKAQALGEKLVDTFSE